MANHDLEKVDPVTGISEDHHDPRESPLHESSEVPLAPIVKFTFVLFVVMFGSMALMLLLYNFWYTQFATRTTGASPLVNIETPNFDPRIQVDEPSVLRQINSENEAALAGRGAEKLSIDDAMKHVAEAGRLPGGPDWTLRPDEQMVGGVILNAEQVKYANTPPSQAPAGSPAPTAGEVPAATPVSTTTPTAAPARPAAAAPAAAPKPAAVGNATGN